MNEIAVGEKPFVSHRRKKKCDTFQILMLSEHSALADIICDNI